MLDCGPTRFVAESSLQTLVHEIRQAIDHGGSDRPGSAQFMASAIALPEMLLVSDAPCSVGASRAAGRVAVQ